MHVPHQGSLGAKNSRLVLWETALEKSQQGRQGGGVVLPWRGPVPLGMGAAWTPPPKPSDPCRCPKPQGCAEVGCSPPAVSSWKRSSGICLGWERGGSDSWGGQNPPGRSQSGLCCFPACHSQECHSPSPLPKKKKNNSRSHVYSFCSWTEAVSLWLSGILAPGLAIGPHAGRHGDGTQTSALLPWTQGCCSQMWCPRGAGPAASTLLGS